MFEHAFFEFHATIHATEIKKDCYRSSSLNRGVLRGYLPFYYYSVFFLVYEIVEIQPSFSFCLRVFGCLPNSEHRLFSPSLIDD